MTPTGNRKILIIGNGPSTRRLAEIGFHRIPEDIDTFGMGAAYRYFYAIGWWPTYYAWCDTKVVHSHRNALKSLIHDAQIPTKRFFFSLPLSEQSRFELIDHSSTGDFCLLKSIDLGYDEVYLIGIEGNYVEEIPESRALTPLEVRQLHAEAPEIKLERLKNVRIITKNPSQNENYFFPWYQLKGDLYSLPLSTRHRERWKKVIDIADVMGTKIWNLSSNSKLDALDRRPLEEVVAPVDAALARVGAKRGGDRIVLLAFPSLRTQVENEFWRLFCSELRSRGYFPVMLSAYYDDAMNNVVAEFCEQVFVYAYAPKYAKASGSMGSEGTTKPRSDPVIEHVCGFHASNLVLLRTSKGEFSVPYMRRARKGSQMLAERIEGVLSTLSPDLVVIANDTVPSSMMVRRFAQRAFVPCFHIERSPLENMWVEPDGFYAHSKAWLDAKEAAWADDTAHDAVGEAIMSRLAVNPAMHRSEDAGTFSRKAQKRTAAGDRAARHRFLIVMDAAMNTGWVPIGHPLRPINYPLFETPEEAVKRICEIARVQKADVVLKPHPNDYYFNEIARVEGVRLFTGPVDEALEQADIVFCFLSKVAFAAIARGKKTVILAPNIAALSGVGFHCQSVEEIPGKVEEALSYHWTEADTVRTRRFFGWLGQEYFVSNDLSNPGARKLLDHYFPGREGGARADSEEALAERIGAIPGVFSRTNSIAPAEKTLPSSSIIYGPLERADDVRLDEVNIILRLVKAGVLAPDGARGVMLDVGACKGRAFSGFARAGWAVHAFEPNPPLYDHILANQASADVTVNQLAVSDVSGQELPFYTSEESIGISSLSPFRDSHQPTAIVRTIRLDDYVREHGIDNVDFLKIDTEGFDLMVLRSLDWSRIRPKAIVCEFEDFKTDKLGYSVEDTARFLQEQGYSIYASEWHPITRYGGGEHRWRALHRWQAGALPKDAWGNLIAFRDPIPEQALLDATWQMAVIGKLGAAEKAPGQKEPKQKNPSAGGDGRLDEPLYTRFALWARDNSPIVFHSGRLAMWGLRTARRHAGWALAFVGALVALIALGFLPAIAPFGILSWLAAGLLFAAGAIVACGVYAESLYRRYELTFRQRQNALLAGLRGRLSRAEAEIAELAKATEDTRRKADSAAAREEAMKSDIAKAAKASEKALKLEIAAAIKASEEAMKPEIANAAKASEEVVTERVIKLAKATEHAKKKAESAIAKIAGLAQATEDCRQELDTVRSQAVSLDILSALRATRPLWAGSAAAGSSNEQFEVEHGHAVLMAALVDEENKHPGTLAGKTLLEIGTTREHHPAQKSTEKLAIFTAMTGMSFITVDVDPINVEHAQRILPYLNPSARAFAKKGEVYLAAYPKPLDYVYLDAFDFDHGRHSQLRQDRYRKLLDTSINDEACWKMHQKCAEAIVGKMAIGGMVAFDDTSLDDQGNYAGKGKLAVPLLLDNGFTVAARVRRTVVLKRVGMAQESADEASIT